MPSLGEIQIAGDERLARGGPSEDPALRIDDPALSTEAAASIETVGREPEGTGTPCRLDPRPEPFRARRSRCRTRRYQQMYSILAVASRFREVMQLSAA